MGRPGLGFLLWMAGLGLGSVSGQSVADGSVKGNVYTNRYFKVSLTLPPNLHAVDVSSLHVHGTPGTNEFLMLAARENSAPSGMLLLAEKLNASASHIVDEQDFLRRVRATWDAGEIVDGQQLRMQKDGLTFHELDYEIPKSEFASAIVTRIGQYLLVFRCNATTREELRAMDDAVISMRHE